MKATKRFLTLLLLLITNISFSQHLAPLKVGNEWIYLRDNNRLTKYTIVDDSVMVDSIPYYEVKINNWVPPMLMTRYVRTEGEFYRLKMRASMSEFEEIYYKENAHVGDIWYQEYDTVSYNEVLDSAVVSVFGQTVTMKLVQVNADGLLVQYEEWWTEEFGKHFEYDFWGVKMMHLYGCVIDSVVYGDTSFYPTSIDTEIGTISDYKLYQNFPNPFNPVTTIRYSVPTESFITLKVYNNIGEEIKTLVNELQPVGIYSIEFNAKDLPSGAYFYTITTGKFRETKKMVLMK